MLFATIGELYRAFCRLHYQLLHISLNHDLRLCQVSNSIWCYNGLRIFQVKILTQFIKVYQVSRM